jgi:hypothetical protein
VTAFAACGRPIHVWEAHTYATSIPASLNVSTLGQERVVALLPATYGHLQGYIPMVSHALIAACAETDPPLRPIPEHKAFNEINHHQLIEEYADPDPTYAASRLLSEKRLKQLGSALGVKYVLQPGFAYVSEDLEDKFEFGGFVFVKTRVSTIGLWFRLWDAQTGEFLLESNGAATVAAGLFQGGAAVSLHETTRRLWRQMIKEAVFSGKTKSHTLQKDAPDP